MTTIGPSSSAAEATTWSLVTTWPSRSRTKPEPVAPPVASVELGHDLDGAGQQRLRHRGDRAVVGLQRGGGLRPHAVDPVVVGARAGGELVLDRAAGEAAEHADDQGEAGDGRPDPQRDLAGDRRRTGVHRARLGTRAEPGLAGLLGVGTLGRVRHGRGRGLGAAARLLLGRGLRLAERRTVRRRAVEHPCRGRSGVVGASGRSDRHRPDQGRHRRARGHRRRERRRRGPPAAQRERARARWGASRPGAGWAPRPARPEAAGR